LRSEASESIVVLLLFVFKLSVTHGYMCFYVMQNVFE